MNKIQNLTIGFLAIFTVFSNGPFAHAAFSDVSSGHLNADAIDYVQEQGIVGGYPDGTYQPNRTINRAEFTKIVIEAQFIREEIDSCLAAFFPDVPANQWFTKYVCVAKTNNIIEGYPDGTFRPGQNISFVEAAKIIVVTLGYPFGSDAIWYKPYVERLGEEKSIPTTIDRFDKNISRGEMAEMIYRLKAQIKTKATQTYNALVGVQEAPPESSVKEFVVTAKRFDFTPSTIRVTEGDTVRLIITSTDVTHGFSISAFGVNESLPPGDTKTIEFVADKTGTFPFFCSIFCGSGHGSMKGSLVVTE